MVFIEHPFSTSVDDVRGFDDSTLLAAQRSLAAARATVDAAAAVVAGEISHRSRRELGSDGLAQRAGFRTAEKLVQHATGSTSRDATRLVSVGSILVAPSPWLASVGAAVTAGTLTVDAAESIRRGLGEPSLTVSSAQLRVAADALLHETLDADELLTRARDLRDALDAAGVADRERQIHEERSIRRVRRPNGLSRYIVDPDIEAAAYWDDLYDKLATPRRSGPRFDSAPASDDDRTMEQFAHDAITELLRLGAAAEPAIVGFRQPAVRVLVTATALQQREALGRLEGAQLPVSIATVERVACASGTVPLLFDDDGQALNVGREQRLFTTRQRIALAARDGGCRWNGCDRPPSWCEAHHIKHWQRDHGRTDVADGTNRKCAPSARLPTKRSPRTARKLENKQTHSPRNCDDVSMLAWLTFGSTVVLVGITAWTSIISLGLAKSARDSARSAQAAAESAAQSVLASVASVKVKFGATPSYLFDLGDGKTQIALGVSLVSEGATVFVHEARLIEAVRSTFKAKSHESFVSVVLDDVGVRLESETDLPLRLHGGESIAFVTEPVVLLDEGISVASLRVRVWYSLDGAGQGIAREVEWYGKHGVDYQSHE